MRCTRVHSRSNSADRRVTSYSKNDVNNYLRRLVGEFVGTFILTWSNAWLALSLANTAVVFADQPNKVINIAADAFGSGLTLAGLVYALGHISGAHFNPSISLAFVLRGDMTPLSWFPYALVQFAGGFAAAGILAAVFINDEAHGYLGANHPAGGLTVNAAFWMEFIGSLFLQLAVVGTATRGKNIGGHAALAAGLTLGALIAMLAPFGGGSLNPARSLGTGVLANSSSVRGIVWLYIVAPIGAALVSAPVMCWLTPSSDEQGENKNATGLGEGQRPIVKGQDSEQQA